MGTSEYAFLLTASVALAIMGAAIIMQPSDSAIPPTPAFSKVYINGVPIEAESHDDKLYITTSGIITSTISGKTITFNAKQPSMTCPVLQGVRGFDSSGNPICGVI